MCPCVIGRKDAHPIPLRLCHPACLASMPSTQIRHLPTPRTACLPLLRPSLCCDTRYALQPHSLCLHTRGSIHAASLFVLSCLALQLSLPAIWHFCDPGRMKGRQGHTHFPPHTLYRHLPLLKGIFRHFSTVCVCDEIWGLILFWESVRQQQLVPAHTPFPAFAWGRGGEAASLPPSFSTPGERPLLCLGLPQ